MKIFLIAVLLCVLSIGTPQTANSKPKKPLIDREQIAQFEQTVQQNIATPEFTTSLSATTLDNGDFDIKKYETPEPEHLTREEYLMSFEEEQCPDPFKETDWEVTNRHKDIDSTYYHGAFCKLGKHVTMGKIRKHEMKHSDPNRRGICTCSATACIDGYHVENGVCKEDMVDAEGNCLRKEFNKTDGINDNKNLCMNYCMTHAENNKCNYQYAIFYTETNKCVCNPTNDEINAEKQLEKSSELQKRKNRLDKLGFKDVCITYWNQRNHNTDTCVDKVFADINVQQIHGVALAKEYMVYHYNHNYEDIVCETGKPRSSNNQDYISCSALGYNGYNHYYEFEFDDLVESWDTDIQEDLRVGLCEKVFNRHFDGKACNPQGLYNTNEFVTAATRVGIFSRKGDGNSVHLTNGISKKNYTTNKGNEWTAGFDPYAFYEQIQASSGIERIVEEYIVDIVQTNAPKILEKAQENFAASITCNAGYVTHTGKIDDRDTEGNGDDVLTCTLTLSGVSTKLDFVFDDLSENWDSYSKGGYENISCTAVGGVPSGTTCLNLDQNTCNRIAKFATSNQPVWDPATNTCKLPNAEKAQKTQQAIKLSIIVGGMILGVVAIVASGGSVLVAAGGLASFAGGGLELDATRDIYREIDEFFLDVSKCREESCAKPMLKKWMQKINNYTGDATATQISGIDNELARLAQLLPPDDDFYTDMLLILEHQGKFDPETWEKEHIQRTIGVALQVVGVFSGIAGLFIKGSAATFIRLPNVIKTKLMSARTARGAWQMTQTITTGTINRASEAYTTYSAIQAATATTQTIIALSKIGFRRRASRKFDQHLNYFKQTGKNKVGMSKSRLNDDEWAQLNHALIQEHSVQMVEYVMDGKLYMKFEKYTPSQT